ncbi:MAG: bifunctional 4-hydroxy-2-oxoglutarate aldolase/2-dehydro-3-deoxy-phosphogluconate aldolase [Pirellulales bacterium]|nr:bifunctional 4-hydroxy-2-oxoglutarate aldolase/2-dehydro-3-deoxy-phosphogluconate aldolase [Pirellulales bacterium]
MQKLAQRYITLHQQGFVPIFVGDRFDAVMLAEASVAAGARVVEITCRRENVCEDIRRIKRAFPELMILVGSTVDDGPMIDFLRRRKPQMPTIGELCDLGVDGIVSAMPLSLETVSRLSQTHIVVPGVESITEAVQAVSAGAHFAKFFTTAALGEHDRVALATNASLHGLLPIFVTGGVTCEKIKLYVQSRVALLGSGWDLMLGDRYQTLQQAPDVQELTAMLKSFLTAMADARKKHQSISKSEDYQDYLRSLPHYHPFDALLDDIEDETLRLAIQLTGDRS